MERRQLEYFVAVAKEGSLAAAAAVLHVSQPALSQGIRQLESELHTELFDRLPRGMRLNAAGQALLNPAKLALRNLATAKSSVDEIIGLRAGTLEIITMPGLVFDPLAEWFREFRRRAPRVRIRVQETDSPEDIPKAVRAGDAELGFIQDVGNCEDLVVMPLGLQAIVAVFPQGTDLGHDRSVKPNELLAAGMIIGPSGLGQEIVREELRRKGTLERAVIEVDRRNTALALVLAGVGAGLLASAPAHFAAAQGAVVRELDPAIRREINMIQRAGPTSPAARLFELIATGGAAEDSGKVS